jgi:hypothetical protein
VHASDYIIDILLILVVLRQVRTRQLTVRSTYLPLVLIAYAGYEYFHSFSPAGNDVVLIVIFSLIGLLLGTFSGATTRVWRRDDGMVVAKAGVLAASLWIIGMGFRFGFAIWANTNSGGLSLYNFSTAHDIPNVAYVWTTALLLMAFCEVLSRVGYLQFQRVRFERAGNESAKGEVVSL